MSRTSLCTAVHFGSGSGNLNTITTTGALPCDNAAVVVIMFKYPEPFPLAGSLEAPGMIFRNRLGCAIFGQCCGPAVAEICNPQVRSLERARHMLQVPSRKMTRTSHGGIILLDDFLVRSLEGSINGASWRYRPKRIVGKTSLATMTA